MALTRNGKRADVVSLEGNSINAQPVKALPIAADVLLIEDSSDNYAAKKAEIGNLPALSAVETISKALKGSPGTINPGQSVYVSGWNVGAGVIEVELAKADAAATMPAIGMCETTITNVAQGNVTLAGHVGGLDTSTGGIAVNDPMFVSPTVAGGFTKTRPVSPGHLVQQIGRVARAHASLGVIQVSGAGRTNDVPNRTLGLAPEFAGAGISRPGTNNAVDFSYAWDGTNYHAAYRGESANATLQSSSIIQRIQLPENWPGWHTDAIAYWNRVDATPGSTGLTVKVYDTGNTLRHTDAKQANTSWTKTVIADTDLAAGTWTPGGWITIEYLFEAQNGKGAELGEVELAPAGD